MGKWKMGGEKMRLVKVDPKEIFTYKQTKWQKVLDEFFEMDTPVALMDVEKPACAQAACNSAIKRYGYADVKAIMVNKNCYIVRISKVNGTRVFK